MKKEDLIEAIAKLSIALANKKLVYQDAVNEKIHRENLEQLMHQINLIATQIAEFNEQLTILIAAQPTNGHTI